MGNLLEYAESIACKEDRGYIYISTGETGLYEKYGYSFWKMMKDVNGEDSIAVKELATEDKSFTYGIHTTIPGGEGVKTFTVTDNLEPVLEYAEKFGAIIAIEPVWNHIVYDADRALAVLRGMKSPNLRIIFDPVNLLDVENLDRREKVLGNAMDILCEDIAMVHLKDYVLRDGKLVSVAAGTGEMDYTEIMRFLKARKPFIQASLENTNNDNAVQAREFLESVYASV